MNEAIRLEHVSFRYDGADPQVLKDVSFRISYGELIVLSGGSGEGKSTILSILNGAIPHITPGTLEGKVTVAGREISAFRMSDIARLAGSVLQNADAQIIHERVEDEIAFGCENIGVPEAEITVRVQRACEWMELNPGWPTGTLSGGQKQRLITAAALAMGQKILVFDEPLANLDLEGAEILLRTLRELTRSGYAVLLVEHRLDVALPWADRLLWLEDGEVTRTDPEQALCRGIDVIPVPNHTVSVPGEPLFEAKRLRYEAGGRVILGDVSLRVRRGERILLLGENGCGKTTLLRLMARLVPPTRGRLEQAVLPGEQRKKPSPAWFKKVGFVFQNPGYQLFMPTVREEIAYGAFSPEDVPRYLERFSLAGLEDRHPASLSEGQKRRLGIAAMAAAEPEVLLLDEPTVGQDHASLSRMAEGLNAMQKERGFAMVTVTHDYRCAAALADRVIWIKGGTVYAEGGPELAGQYFLRNVEMGGKKA